MIPRGTTFELEYLSEFEMEINILGYELGAYMRLIHEKNQKSRTTVPLKLENFIFVCGQNILWAISGDFSRGPIPF
jgi:hypothetical protein